MDPKGPGLVMHHLVVKYQQRNQKDETTDNPCSMFYTGWNVKYSSNKYDIISLSNIFLRIS